MLCWIALFGRVLRDLADFVTEIHFGREKTEHANAPIEKAEEDL